jgi:short-subunit dehydrogenase
MKPIAWITGAASGIGKEVALEMNRRGYQLILSDYNETALREVADANHADMIPFDVCDRNANSAAGEKILEKYGYVDLVFLNAGKHESIDVKNFNSETVEAILKVNFLGAIYGVEASLPLLRASTQPQLVAMSSAMSYFCLPKCEAYGASKAAISNFFQGLRLELAKEQIAVSIVIPSFIKTPLLDNANIPKRFIYNVNKAAKIIVDGIERKKAEIKVPKSLVYLSQLLRLLPNKLSAYLINKMG